MLTLAAAAFVVWLYALLITLAHGPRRVFLADLPAAPPSGGWPDVTVVVAARNEAAGIEPAARSLTELAYPNLRVVAVNDRSTDATGEILHRLAASSSRLQVVDIKTLPAGWLGKNHALDTAARTATSKWLLFTDADVVFSPDALKKAVAYVEGAGIDHVTAFPGLRYDSPLEKMFLAAFGLLLNLKEPALLVETPRSNRALGIGAFNLVKREAFERIGGFSRLALSVDDDIRLAEALKKHGHKQKIIYSVGELSLKWQPDAFGYIRGLEKNAFAAMEFSRLQLAWSFLGLIVLGLVPYLALSFGRGLTLWLGLGSIAAAAGLLIRARRSSGIHPLYVFTLPVSMTLIAVALGRSASMTLRRGGIVWRDSFYPLAELKQHVRERKAWLDAAWRETKQQLRHKRL